MSRLEHHLLTRDLVLVAPERGKRPHAFVTNGADEVCPFCPGNETMTPAAVVTIPATGPWKFRVFPNLYPAVQPEGALRGRHEVIVESPEHSLTPFQLGEQEIEDILQLWVSRMADLRVDPHAAAVVAFKNHGTFAGESISHPHSQVLSLPFVPPAQERMLTTVSSRDGCALCSPDPLATVAANESAIAIVPEGARFAYETLIAPRRHIAVPEESPEVLRDVAALVRRVLGALRKRAGETSMNWVLHSAPGSARGDFHWSLAIVPRLTVIAGFEIAADTTINVVDRAEAARVLRESERER